MAMTSMLRFVQLPRVSCPVVMGVWGWGGAGSYVQMHAPAMLMGFISCCDYRRGGSVAYILVYGMHTNGTCRFVYS